MCGISALSKRPSQRQEPGDQEPRKEWFHGEGGEGHREHGEQSAKPRGECPRSWQAPWAEYRQHEREKTSRSPEPHAHKTPIKDQRLRQTESQQGRSSQNARHGAPVDPKERFPRDIPRCPGNEQVLHEVGGDAEDQPCGAP